MYEEKADAYVRRFATSRVLILSNKLLKKPHLRGEDYFAYTLLQALRQAGTCAGTAVYSDSEEASDVNKLMENHHAIILFNVSPLKIWKARLKSKPKVAMIVYSLWNNTDPLLDNLRGRIGLTLLQSMVDEFIVTSPEIARGLRVQGIVREKIRVVPPIYKCPYCSQEENKTKLIHLKTQLPRRVTATYIGSTKRKRLPLCEAIKTFASDQKRNYRINIYTSDSINSRSFTVKNVKVNILRRILSDIEKCRILQDSSIFIAPRPRTTMDPSISLMEAEYHGNLILHVSKPSL